MCVQELYGIRSAILPTVGETSGSEATWDDAKAWEITQRAKAYMREHQPRGWRATPKENSKIDALIARRRRASEARDMSEWERAHHEILTLCIGSWKRYREQRAPKPKSGVPQPKKTGKLKT